MDIGEENIPPEEVNKLLREGPYDFVVKADRFFPLSKSLSFAAIGVFLLIISGIIFLENINSEFDKPLIPPAMNISTFSLIDYFMPLLIIVIFVSVGLITISYGLYLLFSKGAWFIGTRRGLIIYRKNKIETVDWEQFSGIVGVSGTSENGSITLSMKIRRMEGWMRGLDVSYFPDATRIIGIKNASQISEFIKKRIDEGNPIKLNIT